MRRAWLMERGAVRVIGRDERERPRARPRQRDVGRRDRLRRWRDARPDLRSLALRRAPSRRAASWRAPNWRRRSIPSSPGRSPCSASTPSKPRPATRARVWSALGEVAARVDFEALVDREVTLEELASALEQSCERAQTRGRILVDHSTGRRDGLLVEGTEPDLAVVARLHRVGGRDRDGRASRRRTAR